MKRINIIALVLLSISVIFNSKAQNVTTPYSMYGYGILNDNATSTQRQMGGIGIAMQSGRQINSMNPASYAAIDSLTFLWDIGADLTFLWSEENKVKEHSTGGGLDYAAMQFPITKYMGGSVGLRPYSSVGYSFGNEIEHGARSNQGSGGINEAYLGLSGKYKGFSAGVNLIYSFGTIYNRVYATPENANGSLFEHDMEIRDFNINVGLQYAIHWNRTSRLTIGATYTPKKALHGKAWAINQLISSSSTTTPDTIAGAKLKNICEQAASYGVGLNYAYDRACHFMVEGDFVYQPWSKAKYEPLYDADGKMVFQGMTFNNRWRAALGAEYTPKVRGSYWQKITFRAGGYYVNDYLNINGNGVKEYGASFGVGLPTPEGKTVVNLGFEWKHRYATPNKLISENYLNITLGVNFNELWFWQRKLK